MSDSATSSSVNSPNNNLPTETKTCTNCQACKVKQPPWSALVVAVIGLFIIIYCAAAPNISTDRRVLGLVLISLWTVTWTIILWVLWNACHVMASWWLLFVPVILMLVFYILIIILRLGDPQL